MNRKAGGVFVRNVIQEVVRQISVERVAVDNVRLDTAQFHKDACGIVLSATWKVEHIMSRTEIVLEIFRASFGACSPSLMNDCDPHTVCFRDNFE
jgi:hypothetical protein